MGEEKKVFIHCVLKNIPTFLAVTRENVVGFFIIFGTSVTEKVSNQ